NCHEWRGGQLPNLDEVIRSADVRRRYRRRITVVFDGAEAVSARELVHMYGVTVNWKAVERVIVTSRHEFELRGEQLIVPRMAELDVEMLLWHKLSMANIDENFA